MIATIVWTKGNTTVWQFPLSPYYDDLTYWRWSVLNASEFEIAESCGNDRLRSEFIVRRGTLRQILSPYVTNDPQRIEFQIGEFGKPSVVGYPIYFSTSSSGGFGLVAVSTEAEVGVDIQIHDEALASPDFAFLTANEAEAVRTSANGLDIFYRIWTRKEAFVKATGQGLRFPIQTLDVLPDQTDHCWLEMPEPVYVKDLKIPAGYSAAIAWQA